MKVHTIFGLVDREDLEVKDTITESETDRAFATEWYLKRDLMGTIDGKTGILVFTYDDGRQVRSVKGTMVRRDAAVSLLRPELTNPPVPTEQGQLQ